MHERVQRLASASLRLAFVGASVAIAWSAFSCVAGGDSPANAAVASDLGSSGDLISSGASLVQGIASPVATVVTPVAAVAAPVVAAVSDPVAVAATPIVTPVVAVVVEPVLTPVAAIVEPVVAVVQPVATELTAELAPITATLDPVTEAVSPVAEVLLPIADVLTPLTDAFPPVGGILPPITLVVPPITEPGVTAPGVSIPRPLAPGTTTLAVRATDTPATPGGDTTQRAFDCSRSKPSTHSSPFADTTGTTVPTMQAPAPGDGAPGRPSMPPSAIVPASATSTTSSGNGLTHYTNAPGHLLEPPAVALSRIALGREEISSAPSFDPGSTPD